MVKNPTASAGDTGLIPVLRRSPGIGNGDPLQYSCLENPMDRGAGCSSSGLHESWTRLSDSACMPTKALGLIGYRRRWFNWEKK